MSSRESIQERYGNILREPEIRAQLSIEELVRRQIERINISTSFDQKVFARNLGALKAMLPERKRAQVEEKASEYLYIIENWQYKYNCGTPIGTPEHPIMGSPTLIETIKVDWDKLYELMMNALEESGTTWKVEKELIELGRVEKKVAEPTPWFGDETVENKKNENET